MAVLPPCPSTDEGTPSDAPQPCQSESKPFIDAHPTSSDLDEVDNTSVHDIDGNQLSEPHESSSMSPQRNIELISDLSPTWHPLVTLPPSTITDPESESVPPPHHTDTDPALSPMAVRTTYSRSTTGGSSSPESVDEGYSSEHTDECSTRSGSSVEELQLNKKEASDGTEDRLLKLGALAGCRCYRSRAYVYPRSSVPGSYLRSSASQEQVLWVSTGQELDLTGRPIRSFLRTGQFGYDAERIDTSGRLVEPGSASGYRTPVPRRTRRSEDCISKTKSTCSVMETGPGGSITTYKKARHLLKGVRDVNRCKLEDLRHRVS